MRTAVYIKESSWLAGLAAAKLKSKKVAIVFGSTIHLHQTSSKEFLQNQRWVLHELCHVKQYRKYGFLLFIIRYLWFSIRFGYYNNPMEIEARAAEKDISLFQYYHIQSKKKQTVSS